nr:zinc dependent phospholipase C family protein [uncultured Blautia sp.]
MRKKSHILLARYLADQMTASESLQSHRKAFCLGSILPDIKPSFITKRHEFYGTFHEVQEKLKVLVENGTDRYKERVFWRRMGEIFHYIADYFTFPHNRTFTGTLVEHNSYEKELKNQLKSYIRNGDADQYAGYAIRFTSFGQLTEYIQDKHAVYLKKERNISDDIRYILNVCFQVFQGVCSLCMESFPALSV